MKKTVTLMMSLALILSIVSAPAAFASGNAAVGLTTKQVQDINKELKKHVEELTPTESEPYKEVKLENGYTLFTKITHSTVSPAENAKAPNSAMNEATSTITSTQGVKNILGIVLYEMDFTTVWTYDYDKVLSGYSYTTNRNGLGWTFKATSVYGPNKAQAEREWDWTGASTFGIVVAGIDVDTETITTIHLVRFNGTYAWKFM